MRTTERITLLGLCEIYFTFTPEDVEVVLVQWLVQNDQTDLVCPFTNTVEGQLSDNYKRYRGQQLISFNKIIKSHNTVKGYYQSYKIAQIC